MASALPYGGGLFEIQAEADELPVVSAPPPQGLGA
jgi:hypothetical protein